MYFNFGRQEKITYISWSTFQLIPYFPPTCILVFSNTIPSNMPCSVKLHALDNGVVSPVWSSIPSQNLIKDALESDMGLNLNE